MLTKRAKAVKIKRGEYCSKNSISLIIRHLKYKFVVKLGLKYPCSGLHCIEHTSNALTQSSPFSLFPNYSQHILKAVTCPSFVFLVPSLGFDCMGQIIHNKQNMSHQTAPEYDGIPQQVDPVVVPREYLPLKRFYQTLVLLNLKCRYYICILFVCISTCFFVKIQERY